MSCGQIGADGAVLGVDRECHVCDQCRAAGARLGRWPRPRWRPGWRSFRRRDERGIVLAPAGKVAELEANAPGFEVIGFPTFDSFVATDPRARYIEGLTQALKTLGLDSRKATLAVESEWVPLVAGALLLRKADRSGRCRCAGRAGSRPSGRSGCCAQASHLADVAHDDARPALRGPQARTRSPCLPRSRTRSSWRRGTTFPSAASW